MLGCKVREAMSSIFQHLNFKFYFLFFGSLQAQGSMVKPDCLKLKQAADFPSLANGFVSLPPSANQVSSSLGGGGSPRGHDLYSAVYQHQEPSPGL